ncbi:Solute carrier family 35 member F6 [Armadillidium nasatum]|uniref:Solute carrier family 35 member F6 n=1 Tax=Armadillidium nasatum TaxID=96803 RepID=A0A5N5TCP7_9CRUS|nr:Solute carrier family 35 member F6 [Armadillidium nasatum]
METSREVSTSWTTFQIGIAFLMVLTGSINTLSTKWADNQVSVNSIGQATQFNHPFFQADGMFLGEMSIIVFYISRWYIRRKQRERVELSPVTVCDMTATSTMYLGLTLTYASSFQMLRGAVIVFTGLLSVAFLGRRLKSFQWVGIFFVIVGLVVVGVSDFLSGAGDEDMYTTNGIITGDLLIIAAQVITATQMVIEEKFVTKYNVPPLQAVGWEGIFGFITLTLLLIPFYFIPAGIFSGNPRGVLEDPIDAFIQLSNNGILIAAILGNIISIAFFNFAGVSVTKGAFCNYKNGVRLCSNTSFDGFLNDGYDKSSGQDSADDEPSLNVSKPQA